jgi:ferric-dicitrate binding protein FerR (iron transport regulator)
MSARSGTDAAAALDAALDALAAGASVDECLADWPEQRVAIEPALRAAAEARALRIAAPLPDPAARAAFMAQLHATPQQPRSRLDGLVRGAARAFAGLGRRGLVLAPAAAVVAAALFVTLGPGAPPAEASTLTVFAGGVERASGSGWEPLADSAQLRAGTRLRTSTDGRAVLTLEDGSTVSLEPDTELTIEQLRTTGDTREVVLRLARGRLWNDVAEAAGGSYRVLTPDATVSVTGTLFATSVGNGETAVSALEGSVELLANGERLRLERGESARARLKQALARIPAPAAPALAIAIDAPFAASLVAPDGRATGARPDGLLYHQIDGVTSTDAGTGAQRLALTRLEPGVYTLLLRRSGPGAGSLQLAAVGLDRRVALGTDAEAFALKLQVEQAGGRTVVSPLRLAPLTDERIERLIVTERARRRAAELQALRERLRAASATPTAVPTRAAPAPLRPSAVATTVAPARLEPTPASPTPTRPPRLLPATASATEAPRTATPTPTPTPIARDATPATTTTTTR